MKFCINQYVLIAGILLMTNALYPTHEVLSTEHMNLLEDKLEECEKLLSELSSSAKIIQFQHNEAEKLNYKEKGISASRYNNIRKTQGEAYTAFNEAKIQMKSTESFINALHNQLKRATKQASENIIKVKKASQKIPNK